MNGGVKHDEGDTHIGGVSGDAVFTSSQEGVAAIDAGDGVATRTRRPFVAVSGGVAEVRAASALEEIAGGGCHVAQLSGGSGEESF